MEYELLKKTTCIAMSCLTLACSADPAPPNQAAPPPADVARNANVYLQSLASSGAFSGTVLLARDGQILFAKGYGYANEAEKTANSVTTRFSIASITKTFTATLILKMQQRGLLTIEDPVCKHLAPCPLAWHDITVRHLLMHTSGIPDYASGPDFLVRMREPRPVEQIIATFRDQPLQFRPGTKYQYSNSGYFLLGAVLEKAGGKPYPKLLDEIILQPLGMHDTRYGALPAAAIGYQPDGADNAIADEVDTSWLYAAGGIYSTVADLLKWERALYTDALLPRADLAAMWAADLGEYGYGWQLLKPSKQTLNRFLVFHAGGTVGFSTDLLRYPAEGVTVIILANLHPVALAEVSRNLSAIVFGEPHAVPELRQAMKLDPAIYDAYVGEYQINPALTLTVTRERDKLAVQASGQAKDIAVPESRSTFYSRTSPVRLTFLEDSAGRVNRLVIHHADGDITAMRE